MLYSDLPPEIINQIHLYCAPPTLAALCLTNKASRDSSDDLLYRHISLNGFSSRTLDLCLRTLADNVGGKAALVQSLQVSLGGFVIVRPAGVVSEVEGRQMRVLAGALGNMSGLRVLSFVPSTTTSPKEQCEVIEKVLCGRSFELEALYTGHLERPEMVLESQPKLRVIGLWNLGTHNADWWKTIGPFRLGSTTAPLVFSMQNMGRPACPYIDHLSLLSAPTTCTFSTLHTLPLFFTLLRPSFDHRQFSYRSTYPAHIAKLDLYLSDLSAEGVSSAQHAVQDFVRAFPNTQFLDIDVKPGVAVGSFLAFKPILRQIPGVHTVQIHTHVGGTATEAEEKQIQRLADECSRSACLGLYQVSAMGVRVYRMGYVGWTVGYEW